MSAFFCKTGSYTQTQSISFPYHQSCIQKTFQRYGVVYGSSMIVEKYGSKSFLAVAQCIGRDESMWLIYQHQLALHHSPVLILIYKPLQTVSVFYHLGGFEVFRHDRPSSSVSDRLWVDAIDAHVTLQSVKPSHLWTSSGSFSCHPHV